MRHPTLPLRAYIDRLRTLYGRPKRPIPSGPFEWIIWEHVAVVPDDEQRALVFRTLRQRIGTTPQAVLRTPKPKMLELLAPGGPNAAARLARLREAAHLMIEIGLARVRTLVRESPAEAKKLLKRFKGIGETGADRILLFCRTQATLAPEARLDEFIAPSKGCYPGQETIARIRNLGHVNRLFVQLEITNDQLPARGDKVFADEKEIGEITSAVWSFARNAPLVLGYTRREHSAAGTRVQIVHGDARLGAVIIM